MPCINPIHLTVALAVVVYAVAFFFFPVIAIWTWGLALGIMGLAVGMLFLWFFVWVFCSLLEMVSEKIFSIRNHFYDRG